MTDAAKEESETSETIAVIDVEGLFEISNATGNVRASLLAQLESGEIAVPSCVWKEFLEAYPEEAVSIEPFVSSKVRQTTAHFEAAATMVDEAGLGLSSRVNSLGSGLYAAGVATCLGLTLITSSGNEGAYSVIAFEAVGVNDWLSS